MTRKQVSINGQWLQDRRGVTRRMTTLYKSPLYRHGEPRVAVATELNETRIGKTNEMRLVFNTTLTVDVSANDDELRKAFLELVTMSARAIYGPAAMLAKTKPILKITETSRDGMVDIDVFSSEVVGGVDFD